MVVEETIRTYLPQEVLENIAQYYAHGMTPEILEKSDPEQAQILRFYRGLIIETGQEDQFDTIMNAIKIEQDSNKPQREIVYTSEPIPPQAPPIQEKPTQTSFLPEPTISPEEYLLRALRPDGKKKPKKK